MSLSVGMNVCVLGKLIKINFCKYLQNNMSKGSMSAELINPWSHHTRLVEEKLNPKYIRKWNLSKETTTKPTSILSGF